MNEWLYPKAVEAVERACALFLSGELSACDLQAALYKAEQEILAYEERWLRSLLCDAENRIEEITYTESSERHSTLIILVVHQLLESMQRGHSLHAQ
ncbi:hypothetical protein [Pseudomonas sp. EMN2]|uniref:hypothetical protein n=1 Tax=Pseudomonas sp. EMN2 TaxID=2615212 RepID=UPI00129A1DC3|nr:hypothetical protein [Pseudomonas sp. EMN2]